MIQFGKVSIESNEYINDINLINNTFNTRNEVNSNFKDKVIAEIII